MTKKKSDMENYQDKLMAQAKGTMGLGVTTTVGSLAVGSIGAMVPGGAATPAVGSINAGFNLLNVGNLAGIGMGIAKDMSSMSCSKPVQKAPKQTTTNDRIKRMLW